MNISWTEILKLNTKRMKGSLFLFVLSNQLCISQFQVLPSPGTPGKFSKSVRSLTPRAKFLVRCPGVARGYGNTWNWLIHYPYMDFNLENYHINPIWTQLFANLKRLGGPRNLAISSQMTMKLGKGILWVEIFTNWQKFFMTSSACRFYDIIKMWQQKK